MCAGTVVRGDVCRHSGEGGCVPAQWWVSVCVCVPAQWCVCVCAGTVVGGMCAGTVVRGTCTGTVVCVCVCAGTILTVV